MIMGWEEGQLGEQKCLEPWGWRIWGAEMPQNADGL
jgi:hypothetical protein